MTKLQLPEESPQIPDLEIQLEDEASKNNWKVFIPDFKYCTDNAGMIAIAGHFLYELGKFGELSESPLPRMPF